MLTHARREDGEVLLLLTQVKEEGLLCATVAGVPILILLMQRIMDKSVLLVVPVDAEGCLEEGKGIGGGIGG